MEGIKSRNLNYLEDDDFEDDDGKVEKQKLNFEDDDGKQKLDLKDDDFKDDDEKLKSRNRTWRMMIKSRKFNYLEDDGGK